MSQQDKSFGSSTPSVAPRKRKCGRPRKQKSVVAGENMPVTSEHVLNVNQTSKETDYGNDVKVGHVVTGVIEATCDGAFLLKVQLAGSETCLRGVAFVSEPIAPVTCEAAHNQQAQLYCSVALAGQCSKQPAVHHVHNLNEGTNDYPQNSNMELNQPLIVAEPESVPSEQSSRSRFKIQYRRRKRAFDT